MCASLGFSPSHSILSIRVLKWFCGDDSVEGAVKSFVELAKAAKKIASDESSSYKLSDLV
jgi:hypothetical protein